MSFKTTYGLFAILLLFLGVAAVMLFTGTKPADDAALLPGPRALKLVSKDFDKVTIEKTGANPETIVFQRLDDKQWKIEKPADARADAAAIDRLIDDILAARKDGKAEPSKKLAEFGLDKPAVVVTLGRKGSTTYKLMLGQVSLGGANANVFATSGERAGLAYPVRRNTLGGLLKLDGDATSAAEIVKAVGDFRSKDLLLAGAGFNPSEKVTSVKISDGKNEVVLVRPAEGGGWRFEKPAGFGPADAKGDGGGPDATTGVEGLITTLAAIKAAGADDLIDAGADLGKYGLAKDKTTGPTITVTVKNDKGDLKSETLYVGNKEDATNKQFVRLDGETTIAKVAVGQVEPVIKLLARPSMLRDKQLFSFAPTGCDAVDVKLPGEQTVVELRKLGTPAIWKLLDADGKEQNANVQAITEMLGALGGRPVKDFPEAGATDATLGFDRPAAELTLYVAGIVPEEKKEEKKEPAKDKEKDKAKAEEPKKDAPTKPKMKEPAARLIVGRRDKDLLYVRRIVRDKDGKDVATDFAVSETLRDKLTRGRLEFVDATLPSFVPAAVTRVEFKRGNEEFNIERQEGKQPEWIIRKPADLADRGADPVRVESLLGELARLSAVRLWSEKPTDRELDRYGLAKPRFQATVFWKDGDKTAERKYYFGVETDDKSGTYARMEGRDLVFTVARNAVPSLESGEIRDAVVFQLPPGRVTGIKLNGWRDVVGTATVRDLERKGASNWALRGDDKIKLSVGQCESLLNLLSLVRAEKYVVQKTGPKAEHKLDVAAGGLEITISLEGEKDPVTLTIGGLDAEGRHYFATSSKLPGDVFLIAKGPFEAVKAKPGFFAAD
ncbi:MAG: DUF4340 domain-containing protein [Gemmataceae bacterium]|nr:DUF4340 domain-containing protein [Gemmataceae bacterium]